MDTKESDRNLEKAFEKICTCKEKDVNYWYIRDEGVIVCRKCQKAYYPGMQRV